MQSRYARTATVIGTSDRVVAGAIALLFALVLPNVESALRADKSIGEHEPH